MKTQIEDVENKISADSTTKLIKWSHKIIFITLKRNIESFSKPDIKSKQYLRFHSKPDFIFYNFYLYLA